MHVCLCTGTAYVHEPMCHGVRVYVRFGSFFFIVAVQQIQLMSSSVEAGDLLSDLTSPLYVLIFFSSPGT